MNKDEFIDYCEYLKKVFKVREVTPEEIGTWLPTFRSINKQMAFDMARAYAKEETGYFKFSKLLKYKSMFEKKEKPLSLQQKEKCYFCGDTGWIQFMRNGVSGDYISTLRCRCTAGQRNATVARQADKFIMDSAEYLGDHYFKSEVLDREDEAKKEEAERKRGLRNGKII